MTERDEAEIALRASFAQISGTKIVRDLAADVNLLLLALRAERVAHRVTRCRLEEEMAAHVAGLDRGPE